MFMTNFGREIREASRGLLKDFRTTGAAVATLAVGIGASAAIFSVVYGVLLRPLPYREPERIVRVFQIFETGNLGQISDPNFADLRDRNQSFEAFAAFAGGLTSVVGGNEPVRVRTALVSREFFDVLGVAPRLGRPFAEVELRDGGEPAVIVSHRFWLNRLSGETDLSSLRLGFGGRVHSVVGVMPREFAFPPETDVWTPSQIEPVLKSRTAHNWSALARLREGVSVERARADVSGIARDLKAKYGDDTWMVDATVVPLRDELVGGVRPALLVLFGAVSFLLLVACANVINLLLARAARREREVAVKAALGASRRLLVRSFVTESGLLALAGGGLGVLFALWGVPLLLAIEPGKIPRAGEVGVSFPVIAFAFGVMTLVALALGLVTAFRSTRRGFGPHLSDRSRAGSTSNRLRGGLVVSQVALTLVLLVGAGLLARSLARLLAIDPGFRRTGALVIDLSHPFPETDAESAALRRIHEQLLARLRVLPGVRTAGMVDRMPLATGNRNGAFLVQTSPDEVKGFADFERLMKDPSRTGMAEYRAASEGYFETMGIPLVRGRLFRASDDPEAPHVALVSQGLVREKWPNEDPIGKLIQFGNMDGDLRLLQVVGIVGDVLHGGLDSPSRSTIYTNARQRPPPEYSVVVGYAGDGLALATSAREVAREIAPDVPPRLRLMEDVVSESLADRRFNAVLLGAFGAAALLLAVLGIYGVMAYGVTERTREIGLRMALGARPGDVLGLVVGQGSQLVAAGLAIGLALAFALARLLSSLLFQVGAADPVTYIALVLALGGIAVLACYLPARQASRVDPMVSLRYE
jgi:predicted permease